MTKRLPDETDRKLLALLQANAREPTASLARKLGLSRSTVQERIARLERAGIIAGYAVRLGGDPFSDYATAHVMLSVDPKQAARVVSALKAFPEVRECVAVSGAYDLAVVVATPRLDDMDALLDEIGAIAGVERTTSAIVLSTKFRRA